ncbi:MAG: hypothetical protein PWR14_651 [Thermosediminibacterales bacterium]|jgi:TRAP-type mannitol/chloroaromatic compound transport system permease small subunit|nr:hypothetical protein [Thermosediminibacterales bacterium]
MEKVIKVLNVIDGLNNWIGKYASLLMIPMIGVTTWEVVFRYGFNAPTLWAFEVSGFLFFIYLMLGGGYSLLKNSHVNMDIVYARFTPRQKAIIDIVTSVLFFVYCITLLTQGSKFASRAIIELRHSGSLWNPPVYHVMAFLPIGAFLLLLQGISKLAKDIIRAATGREDL